MSENLKPSEVLAKAADLIEPEGAWTQGALARCPNGWGVGARDPVAVCWCAKGAITKALTGDGSRAIWGVASHHITGRLDHGYLAMWNDKIHRKQTEVVTALRKASELAKAEGQ